MGMMTRSTVEALLRGLEAGGVVGINQLIFFHEISGGFAEESGFLLRTIQNCWEEESVCERIEKRVVGALRSHICSVTLQRRVAR